MGLLQQVCCCQALLRQSCQILLSGHLCLLHSTLVHRSFPAHHTLLLQQVSCLLNSCLSSAHIALASVLLCDPCSL